MKKIFNSSHYHNGSCFESTFIAIYKVIEKNPKGNVEEHKDNLMLYHGTDAENTRGILETGFKNSTEGKGFFGVGCYMTESSDVGMAYSDNKSQKFTEYLLYVFLNEVLNSKQMHTVYFSKYSKQDDPTPYPFARYAHDKSPEPTENDFECDEKGRRYRVTPISKWSENDEFLADASFVKPRFLFELKGK